jgi:hypothetical protein
MPPARLKTSSKPRSSSQYMAQVDRRPERQTRTTGQSRGKVSASSMSRRRGREREPARGPERFSSGARTSKSSFPGSAPRGRPRVRGRRGGRARGACARRPTAIISAAPAVSPTLDLEVICFSALVVRPSPIGQQRTHRVSAQADRKRRVLRWPGRQSHRHFFRSQPSRKRHAAHLRRPVVRLQKEPVTLEIL